MTREQIQDLVCTDRVRRGSAFGLVVASNDSMVKIHWDGVPAPTSYSRNTEVLHDVVIERKADPHFGASINNDLRERRRKR
jgi:hypothetical protein